VFGHLAFDCTTSVEQLVLCSSNVEQGPFSVLSTCPPATSAAIAPVPALETAGLPDPLAPAVAAPAPRARFRRLVVFDGRIA
jgi:hypothetical protein